jgi:hypothetical protein
MFRSHPCRAARVLAVAVLAGSACGPESVSKGAPVSTAAAPQSAGGPDTSHLPAPRDTTAPDTSKRTAAISPDTSRHRAIEPSLSDHRTARDSVSYRAAIRAGMRRTDEGEWPVSGPAPLPGAILPARRIVAFYGNPLSKHMGVLGEYPVDDMLARLDREVKRWQDADPSTPVQPALHLIAVVAQGYPGRDGMYRLRMPDTLIERVYQWARQKHALLFLDMQVGHSTVQAELPRLLPFLERPDVELGLDPEFSMHYDKEGLKPGTKIGTLMAADVNYAVRTLSDLVAEKHLPPKVLVVHRFTRRMVPNPREIRLDPRVQIVMNMDGWGPPWLKFDSYRDYEVADPVQFTGFKIFFHNDAKSGEALITPGELIRLVPRPIYIQYQ